MTERWEVTAVHPNGWKADDFTYCDRDRAMSKARRLRSVGLVPRVTRVRTCRVEVVYAWRSGLLPGPAHWLIAGLDRLGLTHWTMSRDRRTLFTDPLGKHSRRRAKAAALAAKPSGPCVLVAIRRRVKG